MKGRCWVCGEKATYATVSGVELCQRHAKKEFLPSIFEVCSVEGILKWAERVGAKFLPEEVKVKR